MFRTTLIMILSVAVLTIVMPMDSGIVASSSSEIVQKTEETLQSIKTYVHKKKGDAITHGKALLEHMDKEINQLEGDANSAAGDAKTELKKDINQLKQKRALAAEKLDQLEDASEDSWESAREGFSEAYKALSTAYKDAAAKIRKK